MTTEAPTRTRNGAGGPKTKLENFEGPLAVQQRDLARIRSGFERLQEEIDHYGEAADDYDPLLADAETALTNLESKFQELVDSGYQPPATKRGRLSRGEKAIRVKEDWQAGDSAVFTKAACGKFMGRFSEADVMTVRGVRGTDVDLRHPSMGTLHVKANLLRKVN